MSYPFIVVLCVVLFILLETIFILIVRKWKNLQLYDFWKAFLFIYPAALAFALYLFLVGKIATMYSILFISILLTLALFSL